MSMWYCEGCGMVDTDLVEMDFELDVCENCEKDSLGTFVEIASGATGDVLSKKDRFGRYLVQFSNRFPAVHVYAKTIFVTWA